MAKGRRRTRPMRRKRIGIALAVALILTVGGVHLATVSAGRYYPARSSGYDVSYPNGTSYQTSRYAFGVIGVTGGRAFTTNSFLAAQYEKARQASMAATSAPLSLYMNLNYAAGSTAWEGRAGPYGLECIHGQVCFAQNYGWNAAANAVAYASSAGITSPMWWLDIETLNSWDDKTAMNRAVIDGAIAYLAGQSVRGQSSGLSATVGIYSSASMWDTITGNWATLGAPAWVAGVSAAHPLRSCGRTSFTGGRIWLLQYTGGNGIDSDYACP